ncbi:hypothetical protein H6G80_24945 [Nostoc sp. FACHB-87]|uniref:hypothetical protein n=1 Tax=Nostocaceae TaxID=1162 RepID=UPI001684C1B0|nr:MULTISPECIES: hypothetical protein [Nostocaceae]MBD2457311.1 hypothetical protein [Nostoc sp. FACHB-87]MBD2478380.1 hypothetical protein [Anabaena sp. FACHB-83]
MKLTDFLIDIGNSVAYYPKLVAVTGGVLPNLFLCQMYYWLGKQKNPEGWIYKTQAEIEKETGLTRKEQETARKFLKARGLLQEKYTGCPRRLEFWLDKNALNQRWAAFMNNLELPIAEITKAWTRRAKKSQDDAAQKHSIMPNSDNIDSTDSAICNDLTEQYILPQSSNTECPNMTGCNAPDGHTVMPHLGNISIYTKNTSEITTHTAPLIKDASLTHVCVCEKTDLNLQPKQEEPISNSSFSQPNQEQLIPESLTSLSNQSESSQHTDNPSCRLFMAAGSFDKNEQSNNNPYKSARSVEELIEAWITDPTTFASDFVPVVVREKIKWNRWVLPWHSGERKLHPQYQNFNPIVVDLVAKELASTASCTKDEKITHAVSVMNTWEKTKGGWTNLMQRYQQALLKKQQTTPSTSPNPRTAPKPQISLAQAIAQDEQRRQQEQANQTASALPQHTSETLLIKEKLFQRVNSQKTRTSSALSAAALLEVEAQLKQALGA